MDALATLVRAGLTVEGAGDKLLVQPRHLLTDELREMIRAHKPDILGALQAANENPAMEDRRHRVRAMLDAQPGIRYAIEVADPDADPVVVTVGIRGAATFDMEIPRHSFDPFLLIELLDRHTTMETAMTVTAYRAVAEARALVADGLSLGDAARAAATVFGADPQQVLALAGEAIAACHDARDKGAYAIRFEHGPPRPALRGIW